MKEFELRLPVAKWMISRNLVPTMECQSFRNCDMVGVEWNEARRVQKLVCVELKLSKVTDVLKQCSTHMKSANEVWAAMAACREKNYCRFVEMGVGLLIVAGSGEVCEVIQPRPLDPGEVVLNRHRQPLWRRRNEYLERMTRPLMTRD